MCENIFEKAKREVNLISILASYGFELRRFPSGYRSNRCPVCGPSPHRNSTRLSIIPCNGYWIWHCFACGRTGDVITAVQYLEGFYSSFDAAEWLLDELDNSDKKRKPHLKLVRKIESASLSLNRKQLSEKDRARLKVIKSLLKLAVSSRGSRKRIWAYFLEQRQIPEQILREAIKKKLLFLLPDEPVVLNKAILHAIPFDELQKAELVTKNRKIKNTILLRPVLSPFYQKRQVAGAQFRAIDPAVQPKTISLVATGMWWWKGEQSSVAVVEGVIDMLSLVAMRWKGCILGLSGTGLADRAVQVLQGPLRGREIYLALDADDAGREATEKIASDVPANILSLPEGMDLNDLLREGLMDWRELKTKEVQYA